jgi:hypothetical protein
MDIIGLIIVIIIIGVIVFFVTPVGSWIKSLFYKSAPVLCCTDDKGKCCGSACAVKGAVCPACGVGDCDKLDSTCQELQDRISGNVKCCKTPNAGEYYGINTACYSLFTNNTDVPKCVCSKTVSNFNTNDDNCRELDSVKCCKTPNAGEYYGARDDCTTAMFSKDPLPNCICKSTVSNFNTNNKQCVKNSKFTTDDTKKFKCDNGAYGALHMTTHCNINNTESDCTNYGCTVNKISPCTWST